MKFSILAIACTLASASANTAVLKKNAFVRRMNENEEQGQNNANQYQAQNQQAGLKPSICVTATYDGNNYGNNNNGEGEEDNNYAAGTKTMSFMSFTQSAGANNGEYGETIKYATDLATFISARGQAYAQEMANTCNYCEMDGMRDLCENFRDKNLVKQLKQLSDENFEAFMLKEYDYGSKEYMAYYKYSSGGNTGAQAISTLCYRCEDKCEDDELQRYYEEMVEDYKDGKSSCVQTNDGSERFIGYTCGAQGTSVELAVFEDNQCLIMSNKQDAYDMASLMFNNEDNEEARMVGEMQMMVKQYSATMSCQMGAERFEGEGDQNGEEEGGFCNELLGESIAADECNADGNNQNQGEEMNQYQYMYNGEEMYRVDQADSAYTIYSDDIEDVCGTIMQIGEALYQQTYVNPYNGVSFSEMEARNSKSLSGAAIFGITVLVAAAVVAAFSVGRFTRSKTELEEPVFQGGALH